MRTALTTFGLLCGLLVFQPQAKAGSICDGQPQNLVQNCGFETGDFTGWTLTGNPVINGELNIVYGVETIDPFDGFSPNSGTYQAFFANQNNTSVGGTNTITLSQVIPTVAGQLYQVSWYLVQDTAPVLGDPQGEGDNALLASFGSTTLQSDINLAVTGGYILQTGTATATSSSTTLSFTIDNGLGEFLLDDTSVVSPEPAAWQLALGGAMLLLIFYRKRIAAL